MDPVTDLAGYQRQVAVRTLVSNMTLPQLRAHIEYAANQPTTPLTKEQLRERVVQAVLSNEIALCHDRK
jgi:hypothetical protein